MENYGPLQNQYSGGHFGVQNIALRQGGGEYGELKLLVRERAKLAYFSAGCQLIALAKLQLSVFCS